jgi:hypothetical protein
MSLSIKPRMAAWVVALAAVAAPVGAADSFRPPAVPLVTHNPYFSVWSTNDRPTDDWTRHWTGSVQAICGLARIDGKPFRFLGPKPDNATPMTMAGLEVTPTRTTYRMEAGGVRIAMTFLSPLLPHNLAVLSRPVTYLTWEVSATDGKEHDVALYLDATAEWAVDKAEQKVAWDRQGDESLQILRVGTVEQPVLAKVGDNLRIDWGHFNLAAPKVNGTTSVIASDRVCRDGFASTGKLPEKDDARSPRAASDEWPVLAFAFDLGRVGANPAARQVLFAYDEIKTVEYFGKPLRPYWYREFSDMPALLKAAVDSYPNLKAQCAEFDETLTHDMTKIGGADYAQLCALAYRQCLAAHTIAEGPNGEPLVFSKENFSNGCIATVDVTYPSAPFFLLFNPKLLRGQLIPVLDYARSGRWKFPFAPHDLGTYPKANGQVYGGGEKTEADQMPVEECGNMLIMLATLAKAEGSADFAVEYWPVLTKWAEYLKAKGLDPENQLCTDDFAGHLAHNTNLSLKAIEALGGYALLCEMSGKKTEAAELKDVARKMAVRWVTMADDGDHFRLAFDKPGTWSQKYNLVWDRILGIDLFPPDVARKEVAFYLTHQNEFGLPLDNRSKYTKLDWIVWTATMAESRKDFEAIVAPTLKFADKSPSRVPLSDWYWTHDAKQQGFQARSVVGGVFIKALADPALWKKWAAKAR